VTVLVPWLVPKFVPVIVTEAPTAPEFGLKLVMLGVGSTVNATPLLATPDTVTTTFPVVACWGTGTAMLVALQLVGVPRAPLNVTVLVPWLVPKFVPVIVTEAPTGPAVGFKLVMLGGVARALDTSHSKNHKARNDLRVAAVIAPADEGNRCSP
jgi:hypothetical protein